MKKNKNMLSELICLFVPVKSWRKKIRNGLNKGSSSTPYLEQKDKLEVFKKFQRECDAKIFVETGTYLGDTSFGVKDDFDKIYTIELDEKLYLKALERFGEQKHVEVIQGDSGEKLIEIVPTLTEKAIFWLDGHYSKGITSKGEKNTPILKELDTIFAHNKLEHVILIDDARCFGHQEDYPSIKELTRYIYEKDESYSFIVKDDIIRVFKKLG